MLEHRAGGAIIPGSSCLEDLANSERDGLVMVQIDFDPLLVKVINFGFFDEKGLELICQNRNIQSVDVDAIPTLNEALRLRDSPA
ncbi:hypothetical protein HMPREF2990_10140 [Corynebacterium sp. HMSC071B10]|nr:hypothetical protein HMPREF2990_10140 [Corynebacterium sp. HMSC071B10]